MLSCLFVGSGEAAQVTFDSPTDQARITITEWACSSLFDFASADKANCTWVDAATVRISFGTITSAAQADGLLAVNGKVVLRGGLLRPLCLRSAEICLTDQTASESFVFARPPLIPIPPTVIVGGAQSVGLCTDITLDASGSYGSGGRPYKSLQWNVSAIAKVNQTLDTTEIKSLLDRFSAVRQVFGLINIKRNTVKVGQYSFTLRLTNFLGLSTSSTHRVAVTDDANMPTLTLVGPAYRNITASTPLTILSVASPSVCASSFAAIKYAWTVQLGNKTLALKSTSVDPSRFSLPAYSLIVGNLYTITVNATTKGSSVKASVFVFVAPGPVTAIILGSRARSVPQDKPFTLDGSISFDADTSSLKGLAYRVSNYSPPNSLVSSAIQSPFNMFTTSFISVDMHASIIGQLRSRVRTLQRCSHR